MRARMICRHCKSPVQDVDATRGRLVSWDDPCQECGCLVFEEIFVAEP